MQTPESVTTITHIMHSVCDQFGLPHNIFPNATINEALGIAVGIALPPAPKTTIRYACIGVGGTKYITRPDGLQEFVGAIRPPTHMGLITQVPFVLRTLSNDLTHLEMQAYRLRTTWIHPVSNEVHIAYYAKVLDTTNMVVSPELNTALGNFPWLPTLADLKPVAEYPNNQGVNLGTSDTIGCTAKIPFVLSPAETIELQNVFSIMFNTQNMGKLTELALVSGIDQTIGGVFNGINQTYTEALACQIRSIHRTSIDINGVGTAIDTTFNIGNTEPMSPKVVTPVVVP